MDLYRCECGTLCRPPEGVLSFTCPACQGVRTEGPQADLEPEMPPTRTRRGATATEPEPNDTQAEEASSQADE